MGEPEDYYDDQRAEESDRESETCALIEEVVHHVLKANTNMIPQTQALPAPTTKGPTLNEVRAGQFKRLNRNNTRLTRNGKTYRWEKHVSPEFGNKPIHENMGAETQDFFDALDFGYDSKAKLLIEFKQYSKVLVKNGTLRRCPFEDVELRKERHKDTAPKFWTQAEMDAVRAHCNFEQRTVFFGCLYGGAWRSQDARNMKIRDIDFENNRIKFAKAKSGRVETRFMTPLERKALEEWISHKHGGTPDPDAPVFPSKKTGGHYFRTYTWQHDKVREAAGVEKKGRLLHSYRHTGARHAASGKWGEKWSRAEVGKLIRDTSTQAVDRYFDILDEAMEEKTNAMKQDLTLLASSGDSRADSDCKSVKKPLYP